MGLNCLLSGAQTIQVETQSYNEENGLSRYANFIHKDSRGIIWVGTQFGLYRFDGKEFKHFDENVGLPFRQIMEIYEDSEGWFWLYRSCHTKPNCIKDLAFFHPVTHQVLTFKERFGDKVSIEANQIESILVDSSSIYFSADNKLFIWSSEQGIREKLVEGLEGRLILFIKINEGLLGALQSNHITELGQHRLNMTGNTYLTVDTNGVVNDFGKRFFLPNTFGQLHKRTKPYDRVRIWNREFSFLPTGVLQIDTLPFEMPGITEGLEYHHFDHQIFANQEGTMFHPQFGFISEPLMYYTPRLNTPLPNNPYRAHLTPWVQEHHLKTKEAFFRQVIMHFRHCFYDEKTQTTWEAGPDGIRTILFKPQYFQHIFNADSIGRKNNTQLSFATFAMNRDTAMFSIGGWIFYLNGAQKKYVKSNLNWGGIRGTAFTWDSNENFLWVAAINHLLKLNINDRTFKLYSQKRLKRTHSIFRHGQQLWLGNNQGIILFDIEKESYTDFDKYNEFEAMANAQIHHFLKIDTQYFWTATDVGLYLCSFEKGVIAHYGNTQTGDYYLPANDFYHISKAKMGGYWLASMNGLIYWQPKHLSHQNEANTDNKNNPKGASWKHFSTQNGLPTNEIFAAYEDDFGFVWIPTPHGLVQFEESSGLSKTYTKADGLSNSSFQEYAHDQAPDGTLFIGSYNGFNVFHPEDFKDVELIPQIPLIITDYEQHADDTDKIEYRLKEILEKGEIVLNPGDKLFNIRVALEDYREAEYHQFAYKIEGFQEEWSEDKSNLIRISGLPFGNYLLKIRGRLHSGLIAAPILEIPIRVLKPFYLQTWFFAFSLATFLLSVFLIYKWRTRRMAARQKELEVSIANATETIRQKNEELKNLDKVKSRFFANVSHELRTPITLVLGPLTTLVKGGFLNPKDQSLAELGKKNARSLLKLVNEILDLTKMESGKVELKTEPTNLYQSLQFLVSAFDGLAQQKNIQYTFNYKADRDLVLDLDIKKVEKLINNLLSNAFKFTPVNGQITIAVEDKKESIKIFVQDSGRGIHPDDLPYVFDRFYQSSQPDAPKEGGTGIGLSLSMEFAKLMNGQLWAESTIGKGSIFHFEFPKLVAVDESLMNNALEPTRLQSETSQEMDPALEEELVMPLDIHQPISSNILLVEDNENLREYIELVIGDKHTIQTAENGKVAWDLLSVDDRRSMAEGETPEDHQPSTINHQPDLIISDIMMPEMDGYQLLEKLKGDNRFRGIPVIMLTALGELKDKLKALRIGVDDYMTKPFEEEELLARIDNLLRNSLERKEFYLKMGQHSDAMELTNDAAVPEQNVPITKAKTNDLIDEEYEWLQDLENRVRNSISDFNYTVGALAQQMAMSKRSLEVKTKSLTGLSPRKYIQEIRLTEALNLLENREVNSVKAMVYQIGGKDVNYFSKLFKKRFGRFPSDYIN